MSFSGRNDSQRGQNTCHWRQKAINYKALL
jgi:hypothetical protein